ncbi:MAG: hypothetical protein AMXMBFR64_31600 [Myxococcales bacterium]
MRSLALLLTLLAACSRHAPPPVVVQEIPLVDAPPLGPSDTRVRVTFVDVGQGDAILIETPCGAALIDAGGEDTPGFNGARRLTRYLDAWFAARPHLDRTLELVVLTHPHIDHIRGAPEVLSSFRVKRLIDNGQPGRDVAERPMRLIARALARDPGIARASIALADIPPEGLTGDTVDPFLCDGLDPQLRVLWARVGADPGWGSSYGVPRFDNENNHSVVLRLDVGESSFLFTGDLEDAALDDLVARYHGTGLLDVDVVKVGHHGSHNGTTKGLVDAMSPAMAVITMGAPQRQASWSAWAFGHPRWKAVELLLAGLGCPRPATEGAVASRPRAFQPATVERALYGTGWDGTVILEASAAGDVRVLAPPVDGVCDVR